MLTLDAAGEVKAVEVAVSGSRPMRARLPVGFGQPSLSEQVTKVFQKNKLSLEHVRSIEVGPPGKYFTITRQIAVVANALAWLQGATLYERGATGKRTRLTGFLHPKYSHAPNITKSKKS